MTPDRTAVRRVVRAAATGLLIAAVAAPVATTPPATSAEAFPPKIALPNGFQPEGITVGRGHLAYVGSLADGDISSIDLRTGALDPVSTGPGTPSVGLKADRHDRLFVAGGPSGTARVVDVATGAVLASYQLTTNPSFINDVVLTKDAAWFTDSFQAQLYKIPLGPDGALPDASAVQTLPLSGAWVQVAGEFNANGIVTTPDKDALLVVNSVGQMLYRVDPATGAATAVDLGGVPPNGDGMLRVRGRTLVVVQPFLIPAQVSLFHLDQAGTAGTLTRVITSPDFDTPTTVARLGSRLYLPNARFSTTPTPTTPYDVVQVSLHQD